MRSRNDKFIVLCCPCSVSILIECHVSEQRILWWDCVDVLRAGSPSLFANVISNFYTCAGSNFLDVFSITNRNTKETPKKRHTYIGGESWHIVIRHLSRGMTINNKVSVRPAKTQISLGIRPGWSESSLFAWRNIGSLTTHWAHSEDSDQTGRMPRLIWVFAGRTLTLLVLSYRGLILIS